ncbi:hypothetical protein CkaCkLH20_09166 [Colletotrichum karsti]|uniref:Uncharacterized protein n=1 Tax=Colletotrichum karsti TaxID=1095194 RepID=A0A9P6HXK5_9PEZI|nr:uncharacterized protein CkaCkLH20_09166 [Colletotrichum karsti]KAF9873353.1 hypothetical protein CkaCkLH20_09166 [Colletotrichum karsti]
MSILHSETSADDYLERRPILYDVSNNHIRRDLCNAIKQCVQFAESVDFKCCRGCSLSHFRGFSVRSFEDALEAACRRKREQKDREEQRRLLDVEAAAADRRKREQDTQEAEERRLRDIVAAAMDRWKREEETQEAEQRQLHDIEAAAADHRKREQETQEAEQRRLLDIEAAAADRRKREEEAEADEPRLLALFSDLMEFLIERVVKDVIEPRHAAAAQIQGNKSDAENVDGEEHHEKPMPNNLEEWIEKVKKGTDDGGSG